MHFFAQIHLIQSLTHQFLAHLGMMGLIVVLTASLGFLTPYQCFAAEPGKASPVVDDEDDDDWMFDKSTYTHNPKTGKRVDQYKKERTPYRDPNAWFDSPMGDFLFMNNSWSGGFYGFEPFLYFGMMPEYYSKYYFGVDGSGYYPYDGDPNYETDSNGK